MWFWHTFDPIIIWKYVTENIVLIWKYFPTHSGGGPFFSLRYIYITAFIYIFRLFYTHTHARARSSIWACMAVDQSLLLCCYSIESYLTITEDFGQSSISYRLYQLSWSSITFVSFGAFRVLILIHTCFNKSTFIEVYALPNPFTIDCLFAF